ncbi:MAG TPA: CvpA family protein [Gammaproteobacteria bacterium]|nr:CvpA family protein [Gammaproteobacteria bacterium]
MHQLIWVDIGILAVIGISTLISLFRGFVREVLSLVAWVAAFWVAITFSPQLADLLTSKISVPSARTFLAFGALFLATLFAGGLINFLIGKLIKATGLSGTDRMLGIFFGLARGIAIVTVLVLLAGLTPLPKDPWWHESQFIPHFQQLAMILRGLLPPQYAAYFNFG